MTIDVSTGIRVGDNCAYVGIGADTRLEFPNGSHFRMVIYGAFNALGLVGSENNGILILDENKRLVLLDRHAQASSGWYGPTVAQHNEFERISAMPWIEFQAFVNSHLRARYKV